MHRKTDSIVFTCANEIVIQQLAVFLSSLRNPDAGSYKGKIVVLTDQITENLDSLCKKYSADLFESSFNTFGETFSHIADYACIVEYRNKRIFTVKLINKFSSFLGKCIVKATSPLFKLDSLLVKYNFSLIFYRLLISIDKFFPIKSYRAAKLLWMRKHLSKLHINNFLQQEVVDPDSFIIMADSDMLFQKNFNTLLVNMKNSEKVSVGLEYEDTLSASEHPSSVLWSNLLAYDKPFYSSLDFGSDFHEVNVGFSGGYLKSFNLVLDKWVQYMIDPANFDLWFKHPFHFWHEQDFFRLTQNSNKNLFTFLAQDEVMHGCGRQVEFIAYDEASLQYFNCKNHEVPCIIHFAGSEAKATLPIKEQYSMSATECVESHVN